MLEWYIKMYVTISTIKLKIFQKYKVGDKVRYKEKFPWLKYKKGGGTVYRPGYLRDTGIITDILYMYCQHSKINCHIIYVIGDNWYWESLKKVVFSYTYAWYLDDRYEENFIIKKI